MSALSRIHRLTHLFGAVKQVYCKSQFWPQSTITPSKSSVTFDVSYYTSCLCSAQLEFQSGLLAELTYGKGDHVWTFSRRMEIQGRDGSLIFDRDQGTLITAQGETTIPVAPRQGLFNQDTHQIVTHLTSGEPLYINPRESLYALTVADALRRSAEIGKSIEVENVDYFPLTKTPGVD